MSAPQGHWISGLTDTSSLGIELVDSVGYVRNGEGSLAFLKDSLVVESDLA